MKHPTLGGKRVLVVEDEYLIALEVTEMLSNAGCIVVGPFSRVQEALAALTAQAVDLALLDVNVAGEMVFSIAHLLEKQGTPFLFLTGYGQSMLPKDRSDWEACTKPFLPEQLLIQLVQRLNAS